MKKKPTTGGKISVTFELPAEVGAETVALCGDFNDWSTDATPLKQRKDGSFATTLRLSPGRYRFRYLLDAERWENDWMADSYEPNEHGSDNSVIDLREAADVPSADAPTKGKAKASKPKAERAKSSSKS